jgi:tripartite ATP-independent transporter DctP family solute receptor
MKNRFLLGVLVLIALPIALISCGDKAAGSSGGGGDDSVVLGEGDRITKPIEMNIATTWSTANGWPPNESVLYMKDRIEQLSEGRIKVTTHLGTLGGERELIESAKINSVQAVAVTTGPLGGFVPLAEIFMIPFLFKDWTHAFTACDGALGQRINELCVEEDLRILGWWHCGYRSIQTRKGPIVKPEDLKGMKIRVMESEFLSLLYNSYGALPTPMAFSEVFTALQQGAIDGEQTIASTVGAGYGNFIKYVTTDAEIYQMVPFMVSESWWKTLPKEAKIIINQAQTEAEMMERQFMTWDFNRIFGLWENVGVTPNAIDIDAFHKKAEELYPKFEELLDDKEGWFQWVVDLGKVFPYTYASKKYTVEF